MTSGSLLILLPIDDKVNSQTNQRPITAKINYIQNILYKNIYKLSQINNDSIGHDPIIIRDSWVTGDSILTIDFKYYTEGSVHYINLVDNAEGNGKDKSIRIRVPPQCKRR